MSGWWRRFGSTLVALALGSVSSTAFGDVAKVPTRLEWQAPAECARAEHVATLVNEQVGRSAFDPAGDAELVVSVTIARRASGRYVARITLLTPSRERLGEREIESDNQQCHSLDEALAVTLAILLTATQVELRAREPSPWGARAGLAAGLGLGLHPRPGLAVGATAAVVLRRRWSLELSLGYGWSPRAEAAEGGIKVQSASASLGFGYALVSGRRHELRLRLAGSAGPMWARADGFARGFTEVRPYLVIEGGLEWAVRLAGPVWAEFRGSIGALAHRPSFVVRNLDGTLETLFEPGRLSGSVVAGPALHFD